MCTGPTGKSLNYVYMASNEISGTIPIGFKKCKGLQRLALHDNKLSGNLPSFNVKEQPNLFSVYVDNNQFEGKIPKSFASLDNATESGSSSSDEFKLAGNTWQCPIPAEVLEMKHLKDKPICE